MVAVARSPSEVLHWRHPAADGAWLAVDDRGPREAAPVLFAHGFGQTRHAWTAAAAALAAAGYRCVSFDARGHGDSARVADGGYHLEQFIDDLAGLAAALPRPPVLVGASMGGLLGLALAGERRPTPFRALVLVDITPRWESAGVERILGFMRAHPHGFADFAEAAAAIAAYLPHRGKRKSEARLRPLLRAGDDGRLRWHWDPAMLGPIAEEGERYQPRLLAAARRVELPTLLLSGGRSDVVSADTVREFLALVPHARHVELPRATHMLAGDANDAFTREIEAFVRALDAGDPSTR
ncbi:alpha/beta hydrolase fold domain-containing protein [Mizugakiibacter sediminis]|uniref:Alpha/beta hydrolase fold domain-containing protein n=1 Tax=Mizugakiibacter sediminis TaxID=1475481 RepID=A0A0K8QQW3_9GAMM|nr:alpha/beta hydrolase [Mizugakiibacter sediminis]GAP67101.1 alpha/beta hydrolase fold domain-containing protein [Mizugakiibacter sediminis]